MTSKRPDPEPGSAPKPDPEFVAACERARVAVSDQGPLWSLNLSWRGGDLDPQARRQELFDEYAHWQLFKSSRSGDARAAERFEKHWTSYINAALRWRCDPDTVEEYRSLFFERVYRLIGTSFHWRTPFSVYLRTILLNITRTQGKRSGLRRKREQSLSAAREGERPQEFASSEPSPEAKLLQREQARELQVALETLPPLDRYILTQTVMEGVSGQDLAKELDMKRDAVYKRLQRSKVRLQKVLGN